MKKPFQSVMVDVGNLDAPKGSLPWCIGVREHTRIALQSEKATRERVRGWVDALRLDNNFQKLADREGNRFLTWEAFCECRSPYGFGMTAQEVEALTLSVPDRVQLVRQLWQEASAEERQRIAAFILPEVPA